MSGIASHNNTKDSLSQNQTNQDSTTQHNTDSLILNPDNTQEYFDYSKQRQQQKDRGAIPEGTQENLKTLQTSKEYLALLHIQYCGDSKQVFGKGFK
uniref:hypothetical protein n=1 Tax=uncultured Helicobacter sp. TaxID=175537 RepID=UPI0037509A76